jgi:hypothetical protein
VDASQTSPKALRSNGTSTRLSADAALTHPQHPADSTEAAVAGLGPSELRELALIELRADAEDLLSWRAAAEQLVEREAVAAPGGCVGG